MAIASLSCSSSLFSLFLVIFVIFITPTMMSTPIYKANDDILSDVCSKSIDIRYCMQVIKTIPGSSQHKSFKNFTQTSITYTLTKCKDNMVYVMSLAKQASDPTLKKRYKSCSSSYENDLYYLEQAQDYYFKVGDYGGVNIMASNAMNSVEDCQDKLKDPRLPADPSQLPQKNKEFFILSEIIAMLANKIIGSL